MVRIFAKVETTDQANQVRGFISVNHSSIDSIGSIGMKSKNNYLKSPTSHWCLLSKSEEQSRDCLRIQQCLLNQLLV
jgi:hypothetical protein